MKIDYHREFKKSFRKLNPKQQVKFSERLCLLIEGKNLSQLNIHELSGEFTGIFSFSISGDLRAHFKYLSAQHILLIRVGTHAQLYE